MLDSRIYKESLQLNYKEPINQIPNVHLSFVYVCVWARACARMCVCDLSWMFAYIKEPKIFSYVVF